MIKENDKDVSCLYNARMAEKEGLWTIAMSQGKITAISLQKEYICENQEGLDAQGMLVMPPFVEPHIHLDTTQTAGVPRWNESGTLFEGIECWAERKQNLSHEDVKQRAKKTLLWQIAQGIQHVRTHVDTCDSSLLALKALLELREEMREWIDIQIVAFPQEGICSYPKGRELLEESLRLGADVVGAIPHFEFTREYGIESLHYMFDLAQKYNRLIDVHCDEIDDEQSRFLETLATLAYERAMGPQVTASHTTAMHSYNNAYVYKLMRLLKMSGISFVANPLVNIHLQGRFDSYPKRRGLTRVDELLAAGVNVCFGHDDIFDPWYPLGTGNMLQVLHMGLHLSQMMGYSQIKESLSLITKNSAQALSLCDYGLELGHSANMIVLPVENGFEAVRKQCPIVWSIRNGRILVENHPNYPKVYLNHPHEVNFSQ